MGAPFFDGFELRIKNGVGGDEKIILGQCFWVSVAPQLERGPGRRRPPWFGLWY